MGLSAGINAAQQAMERRRQRRDAGSLPRQQRGRTRTRNNNSRAQQVIQRPMSIRTNTAPVAVARTTQNPGSSQIQKAEEQFVILKNSTSFTKQNLVCNPLGGIVFPRLSQVASQYQKFEVLSLAYRYIPSCPTSTQGMVYMAFVPDALGELPTTVTEMKLRCKNEDRIADNLPVNEVDVSHRRCATSPQRPERCCLGQNFGKATRKS
jgi:hypothetical protein